VNYQPFFRTYCRLYKLIHVFSLFCEIDQTTASAVGPCGQYIVVFGFGGGNSFLRRLGSGQHIDLLMASFADPSVLLPRLSLQVIAFETCYAATKSSEEIKK
jgi:hypothetical protein